MFRRTPTGRGTPSKYSNNNNHRRAGHSKPPGNAPTTTAKGLFADGVWHCDCTPRLPAEHFRVKKDGKNHGRWFYTCQAAAQDKRCGFFLWDDDAKPREASAVLGGSRSEPAAANPASHKEQHQPSPATGKRTAAAAELDGASTDDSDSDPLSWPATAAVPHPQPPVTPRKAVKSGPYATPGTTPRRRLPWLAYPQEEEQEDDDDGAAPCTPSRPPPPPEAAAARPEMPPPTPERGPGLVAEVLGVLGGHGVVLARDAERGLRDVLGRHEAKLQGVVRGRDMVRAALRAREAKVVELTARLVGVEAEREVLREGLRRGGNNIGREGEE